MGIPQNNIPKVSQSSTIGKVMTTLSSYIAENFGQETLDVISRSLDLLNYLQSHLDIHQVNSCDVSDALFVYENLDTLIKVSEKVCEDEDLDLEWDMDFHTLDQSSFYERFYDEKTILVSPELKVLLEIGKGVKVEKGFTEAYWKGRYSIQQEAIKRLEDRIKQLESERLNFIADIAVAQHELTKAK